MTNCTVLCGSMAHKYKPISFTNCTLGNRDTAPKEKEKVWQQISHFKVVKLIADYSRLSGSGGKGKQVVLNSYVVLKGAQLAFICCENRVLCIL